MAIGPTFSIANVVTIVVTFIMAFPILVAASLTRPTIVLNFLPSYLFWFPFHFSDY